MRIILNLNLLLLFRALVLDCDVATLWGEC